MSNSVYGAVPAAFLSATLTLIAADTTAARVLLDTQPAATAGATSPLFYGGSTVFDITATSTDSAAKDLILWRGEVLTTVGGATGVATTTTSTIVRATGDFIADGWKPGALVMLFNNSANAMQAVDGVLATITGVTATTLTVNGTPLSALTLNTGVRIARMAYIARQTVAANAGTDGTSASVQLLGTGNDGSKVTAERKFGATELLAVSAVAALSALPAYINITAQAARY